VVEEGGMGGGAAMAGAIMMLSWYEMRSSLYILLRMASRAALAHCVVIVLKVELIQFFIFDGDDAVSVHHDVVESKVMEGADDIVKFIVEEGRLVVINDGQ
jgi:hypothetical protein